MTNEGESKIIEEAKIGKKRRWNDIGNAHLEEEKSLVAQDTSNDEYKEQAPRKSLEKSLERDRYGDLYEDMREAQIMKFNKHSPKLQTLTSSKQLEVNNLQRGSSSVNKKELRKNIEPEIGK